MRRLLLVTAVLSISAWSQPAPAPAQLPPDVRVEMPPMSPPNPWMHVVDLAVPGFIAALSAWIAVWLTGRNNAATNVENHKHEMERWSRQQALQARKDFYVSLITTANVFEERVTRYGAFSYVAKQAIDRNEPLPKDFFSQDHLHQDGIESTKLSLTSTISLGLILVDDSHFKELKRLNDLAFALMTDVAETRKTGDSGPSHAAFQKQVALIVGFARTDLA